MVSTGMTRVLSMKVNKITQHGEAAFLTLLRMELNAEYVVLLYCGGKGFAVRAGRGGRPLVLRLHHITVHKIEIARLNTGKKRTLRHNRDIIPPYMRQAQPIGLKQARASGNKSKPLCFSALLAGGSQELHPETNTQKRLLLFEHFLFQQRNKPAFADFAHAVAKCSYARKDYMRRALKVFRTRSNHSLCTEKCECVAYRCDIPHSVIDDCYHTVGLYYTQYFHIVTGQPYYGAPTQPKSSLGVRLERRYRQGNRLRVGCRRSACLNIFPYKRGGRVNSERNREDRNRTRHTPGVRLI